MKRFKLVPAVSPKPSDPSLIAECVPPIIYRAEPSGLIQPRVRDRPVFSPEIDLMRYRCAAHVHKWKKEPGHWLEGEIARDFRAAAEAAKLLEIGADDLIDCLRQVARAAPT